jgi:hypothetical protein
VFQPDQLPPERFLVPTMTECLQPGAVHVSWLRAGHEVLQERNNFILGLVGNLAQLCGIQARWYQSLTGQTEEKPTTNYEDDVFDVLKLAEQRAEKRAADELAAAKEAAAKEKERKEAKKLRKQARLKAKEEERLAADKEASRQLAEDLKAEELERQILARLQAEADAKAGDDEIARRKARVTAEKELQAQRAEERRKRQAIAARERFINEL